MVNFCLGVLTPKQKLTITREFIIFKALALNMINLALILVGSLSFPFVRRRVRATACHHYFVTGEYVAHFRNTYLQFRMTADIKLLERQ